MVKNIYDENDTPDPMGHYAKSKYLGELFVQENARKYLICRAGWMMGGGPKKDKKFIQKLMCQLANGQDESFISSMLSLCNLALISLSDAGLGAKYSF